MIYKTIVVAYTTGKRSANISVMKYNVLGKVNGKWITAMCVIKTFTVIEFALFEDCKNIYIYIICLVNHTQTILVLILHEFLFVGIDAFVIGLTQISSLLLD